MNTVVSIIIFIAIALLVGIVTLRFVSFKQWLVWAVSEAEKALGSGTGKLKLKYAYDLAVERFGWIATILPFNTFSKWVDEALVTMKEWIESNEKIANIIEN